LAHLVRGLVDGPAITSTDVSGVSLNGWIDDGAGDWTCATAIEENCTSRQTTIKRNVFVDSDVVVVG